MNICQNPLCRFENRENSNFCEECGQPLIMRTGTAQKKNGRTIAVSGIGGVTGIACGGLVILGWLTPWVSFGGFGNMLFRFLNMGSGFSIFDFGAGIGNGPQLSLLFLAGSLAAISNSDTAFFGLMGFAITIPLILIPILGVLNIRTGFKFFERGTTEVQKTGMIDLDLYIKKLKSRFSMVFIILVVIFISLAVIPFLTGVLGRGFYMTLLGAIFGFLGSFIAQRIVESKNA